MSVLLPEGISSLNDIPYTLHHAIMAGFRWCKIQDLPFDEQPPREIWEDDEAMTAHWKKVQADRRAKYGVPGDDDDPGVEGVDYEDNSYSLIASG